MLVWLDPSLLFHAQVAFSSSLQPREGAPGKFLLSWHEPVPHISSFTPGAAGGGRQGEVEGGGLGGIFQLFFLSHFVYPLLGFEGVCKHLGGLYLVWVLPEIPGSFVQLSTRTKPAAPRAGSASGFSKNKLCIPTRPPLTLP